MYVQIYVSMYIGTYVHIHTPYIQKQANEQTHLSTYTHGKIVIILFILYIIRYAVMLKCWKADDDERLSFKDIVEELHSLSDSQ